MNYWRGKKSDPDAGCVSVHADKWKAIIDPAIELLNDIDVQLNAIKQHFKGLIPDVTENPTPPSGVSAEDAQSTLANFEEADSCHDIEALNNKTAQTIRAFLIQAAQVK